MWFSRSSNTLHCVVDQKTTNATLVGRDAVYKASISPDGFRLRDRRLCLKVATECGSLKVPDI